ncbi:MAG TPA: VOC family protein [Candidatus Acidoferrum sp.]|nr:VOC family protein [Candidatus Acidoferrum sp.]
MIRNDTRQRIFPAVRYQDAPAAIAWLGRAFGFEEHFVVPGENATITHAELRLAGNFIMLGSTREDELRMRSPRELAGATTGSVYIQFDRPEEIDALYARAKGAGAEIVRELEDTDYGSHDFAARDPEGNLWSFGTYRPESEG